MGCLFGLALIPFIVKYSRHVYSMYIIGLAKKSGMFSPMVRYNQACNGGLEVLALRHAQEIGIIEESKLP